MQRILVTGGLGFVGAVVAKMAIEAGHRILIVDDGRDSVAGDLFQSHEVVRIPIESSDVRGVVSSFRPEIVVHFAASSAVGDGERRPIEYAKNNIGALACFLSSLQEASPGAHFVHSGSCAVYGTPKTIPIDEGHPTNPVSWYGKTKLMAEELIARASALYGFRYLAFRYFNVAGSAYGVVERRAKEERLIPSAIMAVKNGTPFVINGIAHPTPDGTCIRDYVHVLDLADAHLLAIEKLSSLGTSVIDQIVNLGAGNGMSVREVLSIVEQVSGGSILKIGGPARLGDPPVAIASTKRAEHVLGWVPKRTLHEAVESAWKAFE